ncbi:MAG: iron-sulfur binding protein [Chloroflexi bacterium]|nr:iron-sulfur binding protein [Chloroflexota bacterium]
MDTLRLTRSVKDEAQRLGFIFAGVTTPDPPPHLDIFLDWLAQGRHGDMAYLAGERSRQRRSNPRQILPECRSILVLAVPYFPSFDKVETRKIGKIASYAWGADYHDVFSQRLQSLVAFVEAQVGMRVPNHYYTDTGPILERDFAQRAGLGWIGKNTCLINPRHGSYILLAEILLGIELVPDAPFTADRCGSCTRCLDACPTACILPDRTLDARRCISYLTIELKDAIPLELRSQTGSWVFGCDVCQQVCPWNQRFASPEGDLAFEPRPDMPEPDLLRELSLTTAEFNAKFKGSPVKRAKRGGYLRNVAIALGNAYAGSGDPQAVAALAKAMQHDPEPLVRGHAAWALGQVGGDQVRSALAEAQQVEQDVGVLEDIQNSLVGE